jgi:hypothetical protein
MANWCYYEAKVRGNENTVDALCNWIKENSLEYDEAESESTDKGLEVLIIGHVKWSVQGAWNMEKKHPENYILELQPNDKIDDAKCKEMNERMRASALARADEPSLIDYDDDVEIEIFSQEPANGFAEHFIVKNGEVILSDSREYYEEFDEETDQTKYTGGYYGYDFTFDKDQEIATWDNVTICS